MPTVAEELAESVPKRGVKLAYGEAVVMGDTTLVPIAMVTYGFGGGGESGQGGGGGGGATMPLGVYVTRGATTSFRPNPVALLAVSIPLVCAVGWAISRIVKAMR
ncbi:hypothetical protein [Cryobacterium sp. BB307]|uniref:hypothetical protein n=1 Tax=Cryobacterium sp. BB307 TaxID=2716317 RepID=UPI001447CFC1|nr:hypothetical protein [Cryobacterium sp. BB307]